MTEQQAISPALGILIDALARRAAQDYLTEQAAQQQAARDSRPNPAPLHKHSKAA